VDGGSHASAQVGGAGVDVAELGAEKEVSARLGLDGVTDSLDATSKTLENRQDITTILHGNDTELIFLIDPDQEGLGIIVEDATALRPVTLHTSNLQVGVTRHEEEVIVNQLLANLLVHASQGVVRASKITSQLLESAGHQLLNLNTLFLGDARGQSKSLDGAADTDSDRVDWNLRADVSNNLGGVHVGSVLEISRETVVLADKGVEDLSEVNIGVFITSIDTAVLVVKLNGTGNGLGQGESRSFGDNSGELVPFFLSHVLGDQAVSRLDIWEFGHGS